MERDSGSKPLIPVRGQSLLPRKPVRTSSLKEPSELEQIDIRPEQDDHEEISPPVPYDRSLSLKKPETLEPIEEEGATASGTSEVLYPITEEEQENFPDHIDLNDMDNYEDGRFTPPDFYDEVEDDPRSERTSIRSFGEKI